MRKRLDCYITVLEDEHGNVTEHTCFNPSVAGIDGDYIREHTWGSRFCEYYKIIEKEVTPIWGTMNKTTRILAVYDKEYTAYKKLEERKIG